MIIEIQNIIIKFKYYKIYMTNYNNYKFQKIIKNKNIYIT